MTPSPEQMAQIAERHATVADKIRALSAAGAPRADIARFLGKRYQHVRNVLEGDAQSGGYVMGRADLSGVKEAGTSFEAGLDEGEWVEPRGEAAWWLRARPDGSLVLPKEAAQALGVADGRRVFATLKEGVLEIASADAALERARALVRKHVPARVGLVDEFIEERRATWGETDG